MKKPVIALVAFFCLAAFSLPIRAQNSFNDWFDSRLQAVTAKAEAAHQMDLVVANGKGVDKQTTTSSVDSRSASLVDQSSVPDFLSVALNLVPLSSLTGGGSSGSSTGTASGTSSSGTSGSGSVTATLYALKAAVHGTGVTDPVYYAAHPGSRKLSFTAGSSNSTQAVDNTTDAATTLGAKYLVINSREIFSARNIVARQALQIQAGQLAIVQARTVVQVRLLIYRTLCPGKAHPETLPECVLADPTFVVDTLPKLPTDITAQVDALISSNLAPAESQFQTAIQDLYDKISKAAQISFAYSTDLRSGVGYNHHRGEFIADFASTKTLSWTINASSEFIDRKGTAANSNGGRFATEGQYQIERPSATSTRSALTISFSGEGDWMTKQKPQYTGQVKTEIPIAGGISIPIAYTYQNQAANLNKSNSEAKLGLSIDFAKVIQALKLGK
jgi:hypothetical protein